MRRGGQEKKQKMRDKSNLPLFETKSANNRFIFRLYTLSIFISICFIFYFRIHHLPESKTAEKLAWLGAFFSELWFAFYWFLTIIVRWNPSYRQTFKDKLSQRYGGVFPGIDIFVCTADPVIEPPTMVINTVLSIMAYNYPPEKMSIYLSDDGGSDLTFYALLESSQFSKKWLPFCRKINVEPRSPEAYFRSAVEPLNDCLWSTELSSIKNLYEDMKKRIETVAELGRIPDDIRKQHKGFLEWDTVLSQRDHQTILQIVIDGRDPMAVDSEEQPLPTLVYLAREKRPQYNHHFKAGAMNALIRVSSRISNAPIILNVDCDMYANNMDSVRDVLCFFMDEENGDEIGFVQFPQNFDNLTTNDLYSSSFNVLSKVELHGMDNDGGPPYIGTGCFHRRETLCGRKYRRGSKSESLRWDHHQRIQDSASVLEETCKPLASCGYEENTEWGKEMGLKYGCPVEDVITGFTIQCRGWRSIYFNPKRKGFLGVVPTTLLQSLVQHKRWTEGGLQIFLSQYCPLLHGHGKIPLKLQLSYCVHLLWAANCLASLYYVTIPSLCLLRGISLFPKVSSQWSYPFIYTIMATSAYSAGEFVCCGGTVRGWWNDQRMWLYKRTTSYFFAFLDNILRLLGTSKSAFVVTAKVADNDVSKRYERELMEFGASSPMFTILTTLAWLNALSFIGVLLKLAMHGQTPDQLAMQIILCGLLVCVNQPLYEGIFLRKDKGKMPTSVAYKSAVYALVACCLAYV